MLDITNLGGTSVAQEVEDCAARYAAAVTKGGQSDVGDEGLPRQIPAHDADPLFTRKTITLDIPQTTVC